MVDKVYMYKAFTLGDGELHSTAARNTKNDVVYERYQVNRAPEGTKLFVFEKSLPAISWCRWFEKDGFFTTVWRVEVGNEVQKCRVVASLASPLFGEAERVLRIEEFWRLWRERGGLTSLQHGFLLAAASTRVVDWVKPVEEIWNATERR